MRQEGRSADATTDFTTASPVGAATAASGSGPGMSTVAVVRCESYDQGLVDDAVREAVRLSAAVGGLAGLDGPVLVKPNVLAARPPEDAVDTHPAVVAAVIAALRELGAGDITVGDSSGGAGARRDVTDEALQVSGIARAAAGRGARVVSFDREDAVSIPSPRGPDGPALILARRPLEARCLVSVPKLKTHTLTLLTGAVKNLYGAVPGAAKREYHRRNPSLAEFAALLADIVAVLRPALHVVDAVVAMEGSGPSAGTPRRVGLIVAGTDPVAVDAVLAAVAGIAPERVPTTRVAAQRGLGQGDLRRIRVAGTPLAEVLVPGFRLPAAAGVVPHVPPFLTRLAVSLAVTRPTFRQEACTRCGVCVAQCPADALVLGRHRPAVDDERCIACFCCHELCPNQAVTVRYRHPLGALLFGRGNDPPLLR